MRRGFATDVLRENEERLFKQYKDTIMYGYRKDEIVVDEQEKKDHKDNENRIKLSDHVSKNFYPLFRDSDPIKAPYRIFKGGRSSLKSSAISIKLVKKFLGDKNANMVLFRKVAKYLSGSVYEQIKWAIFLLGAEQEFTFLKSPMRIIHNPTDTAFYFFGVDDPLKIKSYKIAKGYVSDLWFEEAAEFEDVEEIDTVVDTFIRQDLPEGKEVEIYFSYNPPRNPYVWINEWVVKVEDDEDYYVHHSDYEEDTIGVLSDQFIRKVKRIKENDPDYYNWMYKGIVTGLGDVVYNFALFKKVDEVPDNDRILFADITIDTGYSVSATTFQFIGYTARKNSIVLDTFYYSPENKIVKKAPSEFSNDLWDFAQRNIKQWNINIDTWVIDSADGALRNQFFKDHGISLEPARKKKKVIMIENVEDLLAQGRVYVLDTDNNKIFLLEHRDYRWDEDTLKTDDPKVIKIDDHTCDSFQYYVNNNLGKLELKF